MLLFLKVTVTLLLCVCSTHSQIPTTDPRSVVDAACGTVSTGGVKCVSKTQFVLGYQNPDVDKPITCPIGTVCANDLAICSPMMDPMCTNEIQGAKGVCNVCPLGVYNPVCVSATEFAFCMNGNINLTMKYKCTSPTPYCKASFDTANILAGICTADGTKTDCPATRTH